jgi:hypothetical protein
MRYFLHIMRLYGAWYNRNSNSNADPHGKAADAVPDGPRALHEAERGPREAEAPADEVPAVIDREKVENLRIELKAVKDALNKPNLLTIRLAKADVLVDRALEALEDVLRVDSSPAPDVG